MQRRSTDIQWETEPSKGGFKATSDAAPKYNGRKIEGWGYTEEQAKEESDAAVVMVLAQRERKE